MRLREGKRREMPNFALICAHLQMLMLAGFAYEDRSQPGVLLFMAFKVS